MGNVRAGAEAAPAVCGIDTLDSDDDESMFIAPVSRRQPVLDDAAIRAQAEAEINACLAGGAPRHSQPTEDRQYSRREAMEWEGGGRGGVVCTYREHVCCME